MLLDMNWNNKKNRVTGESRRWVSIEMVKHKINFKYQIILDERLKRTINWYETNM
jgi:nucleoside-diphosphate-sugar epimerase